MSFEDRAQEQEAALWSLHNEGARKQVRYTPAEPGYGSEFCASCDEEVGTPRRELGFHTCIDCASAAERSRRQFGR